jgi:hypothetical protein
MELWSPSLASSATFTPLNDISGYLGENLTMTGRQAVDVMQFLQQYLHFKKSNIQRNV